MGMGEPHSKKVIKCSAHLQFQAHFDGLVLWKYYQKTLDFKSLNTRRMGALPFFLKLKYILRNIIEEKCSGIPAGYETG